MNGLDWASELDATQQAQVHELVATATETDGVAPLSEQVLLGLGHDGRHLLADHDGVITGYAQLSAASSTAEVVVAPGDRRQGTGSALVAEVLRADQQARLWAHGNGVPAQGLAASIGLISHRELWQMRLDLLTAELPEVVVPQGVLLRTYRPEVDDEAVLAVNNAAFSWHPEQGGWGADELTARRAEAWFDPDGFFLAVDDDDRLLGFHWTKVHPPEGADPALGEVYVVGVSPNAQGRGLGRVLTLAGLHHLRAAGLSAALLYVESDNTAAVHTYTKLGFTKYHVDVAYGR